ncbi:DUF4870 domain-containing protein [Proteobacteria bacterium 005FR1]|nr:DUF4870 domain-containing protein [Proteobacteria bacterium 005FR1]
MGDKYDQLQKLKQLHDDGVLSAEEYQAEKGRILAQSAVGTESGKLWGMEERVFCMLLHFSQLLGVILPFIPFIGLIVPVVMWATEKDKSRAVDIHGRIVLNWAISYIIYFALSLVLLAIVIGGLFLVAVIVLNIVFAIIGGVKANNGEFWKYPLSIPFFKIPADVTGGTSSSDYGKDAAGAGSYETGKSTAGDRDQTSTLSSQTTPSNTQTSDAAPATSRTTEDPISVETSNLNAVQGSEETPRESSEAEPTKKPVPRSDVPPPDSAAPRPKPTPEEGTPPGSEDDEQKK